MSKITLPQANQIARITSEFEIDEINIYTTFFLMKTKVSKIRVPDRSYVLIFINSFSSKR